MPTPALQWSGSSPNLTLHVGQIVENSLQAYADFPTTTPYSGNVTQSIVTQAVVAGCSDPAPGPVINLVPTGVCDANGVAKVKLQGLWPTYNYTESVPNSHIYDVPDAGNPYHALVEWSIPTTPPTTIQGNVIVKETYIYFTDPFLTMYINTTRVIDIYCVDENSNPIEGVYLIFPAVPGAGGQVYLTNTGPSDVNGLIQITVHVDNPATTGKNFYATFEPQYAAAGCFVPASDWTGAVGDGDPPVRRGRLIIFVP